MWKACDIIPALCQDSETAFLLGDYTHYQMQEFVIDIKGFSFSVVMGSCGSVEPVFFCWEMFNMQITQTIACDAVWTFVNECLLGLVDAWNHYYDAWSTWGASGLGSEGKTPAGPHLLYWEYGTVGVVYVRSIVIKKYHTIRGLCCRNIHRIYIRVLYSRSIVLRVLYHRNIVL